MSRRTAALIIIQGCLPAEDKVRAASDGSASLPPLCDIHSCLSRPCRMLLSRGSSSGVLAWKCFGRSCMARTGARIGLLSPCCTTLQDPPETACLSKGVVCMFQLDTKMFCSLPQLPSQLSCYNFTITTRCQSLGAGFAVIPSPARKDQTGSWPKRWDSVFLFRKGCCSTSRINL